MGSPYPERHVGNSIKKKFSSDSNASCLVRLAIPGSSHEKDRHPGAAGAVAVPRISAFYGITIWMYYDEDQHPGRRHFHARYAEFEASVDIDTLTVISGGLPRRALRMVREWAEEHRRALLENWRRARERKPLTSIEPLA